MSDLAQLRDNANTMRDFQPLTSEEQKAVEQITSISHAQSLIPLHGLPLLHERQKEFQELDLGILLRAGLHQVRWKSQ